MFHCLWTAPIAVFALFTLSATAFASPERLQGDWVRPCENGVIRSETFTLTTVIFTERFHSDRGCAQGAFELQMGGYYRVNQHEMDFQSTDSLAQILDERVASDWNQRSVCGLRDWKAQQARVVTGLACDFFGLGSPFNVPPRGLMRYGIWKIETDRLYLGRMTSEYDASMPQRRPREWDPRAYLRFLRRHFSIR